MASTPFDSLAKDWTVGSRFTAAADTDILLSNPSSDYVHFALTLDDTAPTIPAKRANPLKPMSVQPMQLRAGERLWMAGENAFAVIEA